MHATGSMEKPDWYPISGHLNQLVLSKFHIKPPGFNSVKLVYQMVFICIMHATGSMEKPDWNPISKFE